MPIRSPHVVIIGSGFAGLSAACYLARDGARVTLFEKHDQAGGRAREFEAEGFTFDMGPSWYWMPDVFERFFEDFGTTVAEQYELTRLDPSYQVVFAGNENVQLPAHRRALYDLFESIEAGSSTKLDSFLAEAGYKYEVGMGEFVQRPAHSVLEFMDPRIATAALRLDMLTDMGSYVDRLFTDERLRQILKFPVLFLGATPEDTPALYSLMNYADLVKGTWYPTGGMHRMVDAMVRLALKLGVDIRLNTPVREIRVENGEAVGVATDAGFVAADTVIGSADYHYVESQLLSAEHRQYSEDYWSRRTMAPSSLLYYLGVGEQLPKLLHHNLFFDRSFDKHAEEIYTHPRWPSDPLFYACVPSKTDPSCAPAGCENLFLLIPTAPGLGGDDEVLRERYFDRVMDRLEAFVGRSIRDSIVCRRDFAESDFVSEYGAYKGNAYGLANTLRQTAFLKPKMRSSRVERLYFAGQLTTPGPGVPPSLISGEVCAREVGGSLGLTTKETRHGSQATV